MRAGPTDFTTSLPFARTPRGRIAVDERLRVLTHPHHSDVGPGDPSQVRTAPHIFFSLVTVQRLASADLVVSMLDNFIVTLLSA